MDRRRVLQFGLVGAVGAAGAAGALFVPREVLAAGFDPLKVPLAGTLYYTKDRPGRWAKKAGGHVPAITRAGGRLTVSTPHPMKGYKHYIVKHMILDGEFKLIGETLFNPTSDTPVSTHDIGGLKGVVYAASVCNLHDTWLAALKL